MGLNIAILQFSCKDNTIILILQVFSQKIQKKVASRQMPPVISIKKNDF